MTAKPDEQQYPEPEARQRRDAVLRHMLGRSPQKHESLKKVARRTKKSKKAAAQA
jgi:hypothetical protein